jgi:hypothetical protein
MDDENNEISAEWIVRAQLKIHNSKKKSSSFGSNDCCINKSSDSPCRVVYNWHSDERNQDRVEAITCSKNVSEKVRIRHPTKPTTLLNQQI